MFTFKNGEIHPDSELSPSSPLCSNSQMLSTWVPPAPRRQKDNWTAIYSQGSSWGGEKIANFPNSKCKEILLFNGRVCANLRLEVPRRQSGKILVARRTFFCRKSGVGWRAGAKFLQQIGLSAPLAGGGAKKGEEEEEFTGKGGGGQFVNFPSSSSRFSAPQIVFSGAILDGQGPR